MTQLPETPAQAPQPVPQTARQPADWRQIGTAIGALIAIGGATISSVQTGSADRSAGEAARYVMVTQEMIDRNRQRMEAMEALAHANEKRIAELEKWRAVQEALSKRPAPP